MKEINYAIAGFGSIAKTHALASFDANLRFDLPFSLNFKYAITRKSQEMKLMNVKNVLEAEEALCDETLDFISICTPNNSHLEFVEKAVKYNKAIYCEKPLEASYEDAEKMVKLVEDNNIKNAVALIYRFIPAVELLRTEAAAETIGQIIDFKIKLYHKSYLSEKKKGSWRTLETSGGGALLDLGVHLIDLVQFTLGDIAEVDAKTKIFFKDRSFVDEIADCDFKLENGIEGNMEVSRVFAESNQRNYFEIFGTKGSLKISLENPYTLEIYENDTNTTRLMRSMENSDEMKYFAEERDSLGFFQSAHTASLINFANAIYGNSSTGIAATFRDALKCQKIVDMIYKSAAEKAR